MRKHSQNSSIVSSHCVQAKISDERQEFRKHEMEKFFEEKFAEPSVKIPSISTSPSTPIDVIPPEKSFSVWTSMMKRTRETAEYFDEDTYAVKAMRMLDEIVLIRFKFS